MNTIRTFMASNCVAAHDATDLHQVILYNDDVHDCQEVVEALVGILQLDVDTAIRQMVEADRRGSVVLLVCNRQAARRVRDLFIALGFRMAVQPLHAAS